MKFEYDERKSAANLEKHGIDFEEAQALWNDPDFLEFSLEFKGEVRMGAMARYAGRCWVAIYTMRGEAVRLISVRGATRKEMAFHDKARYER